MKFNFKNQIVVITGGGSGVGLAAVSAFAEAGAHVIILGREINKLKQAKSQVDKIGTCDYMVLDVSKIDKVKSRLEFIVRRFKRVDVLVNCAGVYGPIGEFHDNDIKLWHKALAINLLGTVNMCHEVLPIMVKQKQGKIINLSGGGAVQPFPNFSAYATSKAAVVRFTENLAREYKAKNIQINAIAPGAINTSFLGRVLKAGPGKVGRDFYQKSLEQKKSGGDSPQLAAELMLFLCSPKARNITGKLISAKWDSWKKWNQNDLKKIDQTDEYTLRRIDNKYFYEK